MRHHLFTRSLFAAIATLVACVSFPAHAAPRIPNDPLYDQLWHIRHIGLDEAWHTSLGLETVPVAIIDTGVDLDHPDLKDNIWRNLGEIAGDGKDNDGNGYVDDVFGWDFIDSDGYPNPGIDTENPTGANHGTISAGIVAAKGDNGTGMVGATWQTPVMALRALDANGIGDPLRIARAVDYAVDNGAKVINLSFAGHAESGRLADALRRAYDRGVFVVAAAGNAPEGGEATDLDVDQLYPVCFDLGADENYVYGVAATDANDRRASFSNFGAGCVDGSAPGTRMISTQLHEPGNPAFTDAYGGYYNGTSVAAPVVSGVVALMRAVDPRLTPKQITNILTETSAKIDDLNPDVFGKLGRGRINAAAAVERALTQGQRRTPPPPPVLQTSSLVPPGTERLVVTAPGPGRDAEVRMFTEDGAYVRSLQAFPAGYRGGVSLAVGNFDGTKPTSIVVGASGEGAPQVRVFDVNARNIGVFYAYDSAFRGGIEVAAGDLDGDGIDEIVTGAGPGGGPHVRVFDRHGVPFGGFFAFDERDRGGIDIAVGDLDGDGIDEIAVVDAKGTVRVFTAQATQKVEFVPRNAIVGRLQIDIVDVDGSGGKELVVRVASGDVIADVYTGDGKHIGPLNGLGVLTAASADGRAFGSAAGVAPKAAALDPDGFLAYERTFRGGVRAASVHISR